MAAFNSWISCMRIMNENWQKKTQKELLKIMQERVKVLS